MSNVIQANYDHLDAIAARFGQSAEATDELYSRIRRSAEDLVQGGWEGRGSAAFAAEMSGEVFPALQRLKQALDVAQKTTLDAGSALHSAEEDAAALFVGDRQFTTSGAVGDTTPVDNHGEHAGANEPASERPSGGKREGEFKFRELELDKDKSTNPREFGFRYGVLEGAAWSKKADASFKVGSISQTEMVKGSLGSYDVGAEVGFGKHGPTAGAYGEFYTAKVQTESVIGNKQIGLTRDLEIKGPGAEGMIGLKDGSVGATIGFSAVTVKEQVGANVAGVNVGVNAEVGLKAEFGFKIGKRTEVKLPFVTLGIGFGWAKDGKDE